MQSRDKLKRAALKRKSRFLMDSYRQIRNKVNIMNTQLEKQYYTDKISAFQGNMKESWTTINELLNKRSKSSNTNCLKDMSTEIVDKKDISYAMNNFFVLLERILQTKLPQFLILFYQVTIKSTRIKLSSPSVPLGLTKLELQD